MLRSAADTQLLKEANRTMRKPESEDADSRRRGRSVYDRRRTFQPIDPRLFED